MSTYFNVKPILRFIGMTAFSIFSYAAVAQPTLPMGTCGQALSSLQQRLYAHYLAGPASLRDFVFARRNIYLLDVREVDAWARQIESRGCAPGQPGQPGAQSDVEPGIALKSASAFRVGSTTSAVPGGAGSDGCTTNVLDIMRCPAQSDRTREAVVAELRNARAAGELASVGELSDATISAVVPSNAAVTMTRSEVKRQLALAQAAHQLQFGER